MVRGLCKKYSCKNRERRQKGIYEISFFCRGPFVFKTHTLNLYKIYDFTKVILNCLSHVPHNSQHFHRINKINRRIYHEDLKMYKRSSRFIRSSTNFAPLSHSYQTNVISSYGWRRVAENKEILIAACLTKYSN